MLSCNVKGQENNGCKNVQIGDFKLTSEYSGTTYISRTENHQTERNIDHGYEARFDVVWIDECTYELRNKKFIKGPDFLKGKEGAILTVEILEVKENSIVVSSSSNFTDIKTEVEMEILN